MIPLLVCIHRIIDNKFYKLKSFSNPLILIDFVSVLKFQGSNMKIFVLEKTETGMTQENRQYGITHIFAKISNYQELHEFSMLQKWIAKLNSSVNKTLIIRCYAMKEDWGIRISDYSTVRILQTLFNTLLKYYYRWLDGHSHFSCFYTFLIFLEELNVNI